jgi:hypothetical protein
MESLAFWALCLAFYLKQCFELGSYSCIDRVQLYLPENEGRVQSPKRFEFKKKSGWIILRIAGILDSVHHPEF